MNFWLDGVEMLGYYSRVVLCLLLMFAWGMFVVHRFLEKKFNTRLSDVDYLSLIITGWVFPVMLWAGLFVGSVILFGKIVGVIIAVLAILVPFAFYPFKFYRMSSSVLGLLLFVVIYVILKFAFLKNLPLPSYFDSAEHYRLIHYFVEPVKGTFPAYYHAGFHIFAVAFVRFFDLNIVDVMLAGGQFLLAVLPFSLFFIVRNETDSAVAGVFAITLAAFGWHMPAHLMNWGKYPALLSLVCLSFILNFAYLLYRDRLFKQKKVMPYLSLAVLMLFSAFVHTRILIVCAMMAVACLLTVCLARARLKTSNIVILFILLIQFFILQNYTSLRSLVDGYLKTDGWTLLLLLTLLPFAMKQFPHLTFFLLASLSFFFSGLFVSVHFPGFGTLTLLDRPYVQMLIYLPFSILGGLGLAGLINLLKRHSKIYARTVILASFGIVLAHAVFRSEYYPSDCCQLVNRDDLALLAWMERSLPIDVSLLIASSRVNVTSFEQTEILAGVDGGIWVTPLISRQTTLAWDSLDFSSETVHAEICGRGLEYAYVGGIPQSFSASQFEENPEWYQQVFALPRAKLYRITNCQ
jgi:hypothetical protein